MHGCPAATPRHVKGSSSLMVQLTGVLFVFLLFKERFPRGVGVWTECREREVPAVARNRSSGWKATAEMGAGAVAGEARGVQVCFWGGEKTKNSKVRECI